LNERTIANAYDRYPHFAFTPNLLIFLVRDLESLRIGPLTMIVRDSRVGLFEGMGDRIGVSAFARRPALPSSIWLFHFKSKAATLDLLRIKRDALLTDSAEIWISSFYLKVAFHP
jgi:hypothetical protein